MLQGFFSIRRMSMFTVVLLLSLASYAQDSLSLVSPDGKIVFNCQLSNQGSLSYQVSYVGQPLVLKSALGVEGWQQSLVLKKVERT